MIMLLYYVYKVKLDVTSEHHALWPVPNYTAWWTDAHVCEQFAERNGRYSNLRPWLQVGCPNHCAATPHADDKDDVFDLQCINSNSRQLSSISTTQVDVPS